MDDRPQPVLFDVQGGVATLTLNDPQRLNPMSMPLLQAGLAALQRVHDEPAIRVLVLAANGRGFCAGADLAELGRVAAARRDGEPTVGDQVADLMTHGGNPLVLALRNLPVPVIARVHGVVAGGGVGLALAADIVVAARSACFVLPFVPALGLVPDMGAAWFMHRALGPARCAALTLLGDRLGAEQAAAWGLIWSCVDDDGLDAEVQRFATRLAALPGHAAAEVRALMRGLDGRTLAEQLEHERDRQRELVDREAFAEGLSAFLHKRPPVFRGRG